MPAYCIKDKSGIRFGPITPIVVIPGLDPRLSGLANYISLHNPIIILMAGLDPAVASFQVGNCRFETFRRAHGGG